jgi:hypothetical protein
MNRITNRLQVLAIALVLAVAGPLGAQAPAPAPAQGGAAAAPMPQDQLDSLLAPIALYPDQLLTQTLMASTYPLDVVEAARFVKANKDLKGDALDKALLEKNWDPSVQSLAAFPQVLEMMNDKLDWTQQLGDAFLADQARVMQTVQNLRQKADAAGNLKSSEQQKVVKQEKTIIIEPAQPSTVYVPVYNPTVVYGTWWAPMYTPWYWPPPPYYYGGAAIVGGMIGFGVGLAIGANHWGWCGANWGHNDINVNINRNNTFINNNNEFKNRAQNGNWQHNPEQRKGVAYRDQGTRDKFQRTDPGAASARRDYRGYEGGAGNRAGASAGTMDRQGAGAGAGNRAGASAGTMDRGGVDRGDGPGNRAGAGSAGDRGGAGGISASSPANRAGGAGSISASSPANRAGGGQSFGGSGGQNRATSASSFNSGQSRAQTQSYSNRGASSRASMSNSGGGGARAGGGGGGRGGGRR